MLRHIAHVIIAAASISSAQAQVTLDLINEYPATAISGEADAFFAEAVKRRSEGRIAVNPIPSAKSGLRSRDQLKAVTDGRFAMANSVGVGRQNQALQPGSPPATQGIVANGLAFDKHGSLLIADTVVSGMR